MLKIFHNPRCRKSREALKLVQESQKPLEIIEYLKNPPSESELSEILDKMGMQAIELVRKGEPIYKENYRGKELSNQEWIKIMVQNPILIERPIVIQKKKAIIGRPPEQVKDLL